MKSVRELPVSQNNVAGTNFQMTYLLTRSNKGAVVVALVTNSKAALTRSLSLLVTVLFNRVHILDSDLWSPPLALAVSQQGNPNKVPTPQPDLLHSRIPGRTRRQRMMPLHTLTPKQERAAEWGGRGFSKGRSTRSQDATRNHKVDLTSTLPQQAPCTGLKRTHTWESLGLSICRKNTSSECGTF